MINHEQMLDGVNVMFNKKVKLFLVTLIFMLSISAVAAAESNSTDDMVIGEVDEEPPSGLVQDISSDNHLDVTDNDLETADEGYELNGNDVRMYYKNGSCYEVTLSKDSKPVNGASLSIKLNGVSYKEVTNKLGKVSLPINLNAGNYVVSTSYDNLKITNKIKVLPVIKAKDFNTTYKSTAKYVVKFLDGKGNPLKNADVKFKVNGKTYKAKTNKIGNARISTLDLTVGKYNVQVIHPNGFKVSRKIIVRHSVVSSNIEKYFLSSKKFSAKFVGKNGRIMKNKAVKFQCNGNIYKAKTNKKGIASIAINLKPGTYKMRSINPQTGQKKCNTIKVLSTLSASKVTTFSDKTTAFKVKLHKDGKLVKNARVYVYIKGVKKTLKTNAKGIASVNFKLAKGTYKFKSVDPYTKHSIQTRITVKSPTIRAYNKNTYEDSETTYTATLLNDNGKIVKNKKMQITLNGKTHTVKTNVKGVASITFKLKEGTYKITCKDLRNGYDVTRKVFVYGPIKGTKFNKYGVSEDGKKLLVVGRPSAVGEQEKYGYTFYKTMFERTCPYCGGHNLYWSIFWAGNEHADGGIFPATGRYETGSAEGNIFCKDCDCDFSVFGNEHVWSNPMHLKVIYGPMKTSKEDAYALKSGNYIFD